MLSVLFSAVAALGVSAQAWAGDLALNRPASASSIERNLGQYAPTRANDGSSATRWSSAYGDNQWWEVDLGSDRTINRVELNWEGAYASRYRIRTRTSRSNSWSTAARFSIGSPGLKAHTFRARSARYVRILGDARATPYGISLWDARVCDNSCAAAAPAPTPTPTPTAYGDTHGDRDAYADTHGDRDSCAADGALRRSSRSTAAPAITRASPARFLQARTSSRSERGARTTLAPATWIRIERLA